MCTWIHGILIYVINHEMWPSLGSLLVEEKIDGANLGISFDPDTHAMRFQKRGHWITSASEQQYAKLDSWSRKHGDALIHVLGR